MKAIIYGTGRRCHNLFACQEQLDLGFLYYGIEIVGYSDGNSAKWGDTVLYEGQRFLIKNIQDFSVTDYDHILVTTTDKYAEIREELIEKGYKKDIIFLIDVFFKSNPELMTEGDRVYIDRQWKKLYQTGERIGHFLEAMLYENIAIYGFGELTGRLVDDLRSSKVQIKYIVSPDINRWKLTGNIPICERGSVFPEADLMIVTILDDYLEIEREICEKNKIRVVFIQELLYRILKNAKG